VKRLANEPRPDVGAVVTRGVDVSNRCRQASRNTANGSSDLGGRTIGSGKSHGAVSDWGDENGRATASAARPSRCSH